MDEQDFFEFEGFLRNRLDQAGLASLLHERFYIDEAGDRPDLRLPSGRVIEILWGLERLLSLYDRNVYDRAMAEIVDLLQEANGKSGEPVNIPTEAVVSLSPNAAAGETEIRLTQLDDLSGARRRLTRLIDNLRGE